jgi:osmotically-inducible protein OsmY
MGARTLSLAVLAALLVTGCGPVFGTIAVKTGTLAAQERTTADAATDERIRIEISNKWFKYNIDMFNALTLNVSEGKVLVTGTLKDPEQRLEAIRLVWQVEGVKEVLNEIKLGEGGGLGAYARDTVISTQLRTKLIFDSNISSVNYSIETVEGVVYLMGIAQSQQELDRVVDHARNTSYVKRVVSYVRVKDPQAAAPAHTTSGNAVNNSATGGSEPSYNSETTPTAPQQSIEVESLQ